MIKKVGQIATQIILIISLLITTLLLIPLIPIADQWYQLAIVQSSSMEPKLPVGSLAIYRVMKSYYPGEIIAYLAQVNHEDKLIIHRVVEKKIVDSQVTYLTQGDATQYSSPEPVFAGQVRGKLVGSIDKLGYLLAWLKSQVGISTIIFIFLGLIVIDELTRLP